MAINDSGIMLLYEDDNTDLTNLQLKRELTYNTTFKLLQYLSASDELFRPICGLVTSGYFLKSDGYGRADDQTFLQMTAGGILWGYDTITGNGLKFYLGGSPAPETMTPGTILATNAEFTGIPNQYVPMTSGGLGFIASPIFVSPAIPGGAHFRPEIQVSGQMLIIGDNSGGADTSWPLIVGDKASAGRILLGTVTGGNVIKSNGGGITLANYSAGNGTVTLAVGLGDVVLSYGRLSVGSVLSCAYSGIFNEMVYVANKEVAYGGGNTAAYTGSSSKTVTCTISGIVYELMAR